MHIAMLHYYYTNHNLCVTRLVLWATCTCSMMGLVGPNGNRELVCETNSNHHEAQHSKGTN